ncbi:hypothetical protein MNBD_GAMMA06-234 [hydrothermal vent metagenome]|uniref:Acyltransferase n=1 Tax=hydrothermal vent metagenome TaxID=652676 RepID=A0A3B0WAA4_9ZZZZ
MDKQKSNQQNIHRELIRSPSLYLKEFEAKEDAGSRGNRLISGTRVKSVVMPILYWLLKHVPLVIAKAPVRLLMMVMQILYWWPKNPLRLSCENLCIIAQRAGHNHHSKVIYQQFLTNAFGTVENYFHLYTHGLASVQDRVHLSNADNEKMNKLLKKYGGALIAVPHNFGSAFSGFKMGQAFPMVLVTRNSSTIDRTKAAIDFFERMGVTIVMVRGGNFFELTRTLFSILKSDKAIGVTVDSFDRSESRVEVDMFGSKIGFNPWAAKIAARLDIPLVPSYFISQGKQISIEFGTSLISKNVEELVQHYVQYFERGILKNPASWAFLADRRCAKVLREASQKIT